MAGLRGCRGWLACGLLAFAASAWGGDADPLFNAEGYRMGEFLAPVPDAVPGAVRVTTSAVQAMIAAGRVILIDVLPAPPKPAGLDPTAFWSPPPHSNIPGSTWLPNVGYGQLSSTLSSYLDRHVKRLTGGDLAYPLLIYCRADCWMSWNAAKRLAAAGYSKVHWYPEGITGWEAAGLPLALSQPAPP